MTKPEWGTKRICLSCGARFYDLQRDPIVCPSCETEFKPEDFLRTKRTRPQPEEIKPKAASKKAAKDEPDEDVLGLEGGDGTDNAETEESSESDVIEDTSDLGEDDDDVAEVMDNVEDGEDGER